MSNAKQVASCPNIRFSDGISMSAKSADRFTGVMHRIFLAAHSLEVAAATFQSFDAEPGCMDAAVTVKAFAANIDADIQLLYQMIENEEERGSEQKNMKGVG